ncbi:MAG TPA: hypothetical protein VFA10_16680 [Ktedonobacteraceae bacterium]|nr:hypothetical protein [Ktedonobacteraceae bacterium]
MTANSFAFAQALETFPRRADHPPLLEVAEIFAALLPLQVGDVIPLNCYIDDYDTGTIPSWTVIERKGDARFTLTLIDPNALPKPEDPAAYQVAYRVIVTPSTVLGSGPFVLKEGCGPPNYACSLPQQAWCLVRGKLPPRRKRRP